MDRVYSNEKSQLLEPIRGMCPLFHEFRELGDVTKITGHEYSKSRAILVYYLVQQAKMPKLVAPKLVAPK